MLDVFHWLDYEIKSFGITVFLEITYDTKKIAVIQQDT